mgnify:FL=1
MNAPAALGDTSRLRGGPIMRYGGKGHIPSRLLPRFPRAKLYAEPFFGAGSVFYALPPGTYERHAVNDLDRSITTFFRCLRDRPDDLVRVCEATPYARDEFIACLEPSNDELEEARRVWVRSRQGFSGNATTAGDWSRTSGDGTSWNPSKASSRLRALGSYAARLRDVAIDNVDAAAFVRSWGKPGAFLYCDPPYVHEGRCRGGGGGKGWYAHEMTDADHRRLAASLREAVEKGAKVAVSGYATPLYDELFAGWRTFSFDTPSSAAHAGATRRTEVLWMSYPAGDEIGATPPRLELA